MRRIFSLAVILVGLLGAANAGVVKRVAFLNQSAGISLTTLYTPTANATFVVYSYGVTHSCGTGNTNIQTTLNWTDTEQAESIRLADVGPGGTGVVFGSGSQVIYDVTSQPIQFSSVYNAGTSNCTYDLFIVVFKE